MKASSGYEYLSIITATIGAFKSNQFPVSSLCARYCIDGKPGAMFVEHICYCER